MTTLPPSKFVEHEKATNPLLQSLATSGADVLDLLASDRATFLLVPHSVSLEAIPLPLAPQFIHTHVVYLNKENPAQFVSLNGVCGSLNSSYSEVVTFTNPLTDPDLVAPFLANPRSVFEWPIFSAPFDVLADEHELRSIPLLRIASVRLAGREVFMYIVARPVVFDGCEWAKYIPDIAPPPPPALSPPRPADATDPAADSEPRSRYSLTSTVAAFLRDLRPRLSKTATPSAKRTHAALAAAVPPPAAPRPDAAHATDPLSAPAPALPTSLDFQAFLSDFQHPTAYDISTSVKSFISAFRKAPPPVDDMSRAVRDLLDATAAAMRDHPTWADASPAVFLNATEGLEKYVMTKLYACTFRPHGQPDVDRDNAVAAHLAALATFVSPTSLDIDPEFASDSTIGVAGAELAKMSNYKAPRDKLVCVLNCCKVIFNLLATGSPSGRPAGADEFLPLLILAVLRSSTRSLHSNCDYISRFRSPVALNGEAGYYFTNLVSAIAFLERVTPAQLNMSPDAFDTAMAAARAPASAPAHTTPTSPLLPPTPRSAPAPALLPPPSPAGPAAGGSTPAFPLSLIDMVDDVGLHAADGTPAVPPPLIPSSPIHAPPATSLLSPAVPCPPHPVDKNGKLLSIPPLRTDADGNIIFTVDSPRTNSLFDPPSPPDSPAPTPVPTPPSAPPTSTPKSSLSSPPPPSGVRTPSDLLRSHILALASPDDLALGLVPLLLADYKALLEENRHLKGALLEKQLYAPAPLETLDPDADAPDALTPR